MISVAIRPLRAEDYAPYGEVITAHRDGAPGALANQGTARRFDRLASLENLRGAHATLNVGVFRCTPRTAPPFEITLLERHPFSTQVFVPIRAQRYLVVVAQGGEAPDLGTLAVFEAGAREGISYRPGIWHHPMIALDVETDFTCLSYEDGTVADCDIATLAPHERRTIVAR